jgi:hypothetical protein
VAKDAPVSVDRTSSATDAKKAINAIRLIDVKLTEVLNPLVVELQETLLSLEGKSFGLEINRQIIEAIQGQLQRLGMRVCCPRCGAPAIPRCRATKNARDGSFQFEHYQEGRQTNHGGGTAFPAFKLIMASPDQRRMRKKGI